MIREAVIVVRKELAEMVGDWHSFYGALVQAAIILITCGIIVPSDKPIIWADPGRLALLYVMFPGILAATFSADAFAGERERKTLETLLATPISEVGIFTGKLTASILLSAIGSSLAITAGLISATISGGHAPPVTAASVALLLGGAVAFAALTAGLASHISMRVPVARTAQQMSSMLSLVIVAVIGFVLDRVHLAVTWETLPRILGAVAMFGVAIAVAGALGLSRVALFGTGSRRGPPGGE